MVLTLLGNSPVIWMGPRIRGIVWIAWGYTLHVHNIGVQMQPIHNAFLDNEDNVT